MRPELDQNQCYNVCKLTDRDQAVVWKIKELNASFERTDYTTLYDAVESPHIFPVKGEIRISGTAENSIKAIELRKCDAITDDDFADLFNT